MTKNRKIGQVLIMMGVLCPDQLVAAVGQQGDDEMLGQCLLRLGYVDEKVLLQALKYQAKMRKGKAMDVVLELLELQTHRMMHA